jgi:antitoxin YefM
MKAVVYSTARNNLRKIIDDVVDNFEEYIVTTKDDKQAVIISYDEYASLKETLYLLSSKNNRERLLASIEEIENSKILKKEI